MFRPLALFGIKDFVCARADGDASVLQIVWNVDWRKTDGEPLIGMNSGGGGGGSGKNVITGQILNWSEAFATHKAKNRQQSDLRKNVFAEVLVVLGANRPKKKAAEDPDKSGLAAARTPKPVGSGCARNFAIVPRLRESAAVLCRFADCQ
jgi:hypothetical protein